MLKIIYFWLYFIFFRETEAALNLIRCTELSGSTKLSNAKSAVFKSWELLPYVNFLFCLTSRPTAEIPPVIAQIKGACPLYPKTLMQLIPNPISQPIKILIKTCPIKLPLIVIPNIFIIAEFLVYECILNCFMFYLINILYLILN